MGVNIQSGSISSDKIDFFESPMTQMTEIFFPKPSYSANERDWFLNFKRIFYLNVTVTTSTPILWCETSFKLSLPHSLTDFRGWVPVKLV